MALDKIASCKRQKDNEKIPLVVNVAPLHCLEILAAYHQYGTTLL